jgi:hypothetical protein
MYGAYTCYPENLTKNSYIVRPFVFLAVLKEADVIFKYFSQRSSYRRSASGKSATERILTPSSSAYQVRDGGKRLKQKFLHIEGTIKSINSHNLSRECGARYSRFPENMYSHLVHSVNKYPRLCGLSQILKGLSSEICLAESGVIR